MQMTTTFNLLSTTLGRRMARGAVHVQHTNYDCNGSSAIIQTDKWTGTSSLAMALLVAEAMVGKNSAIF